MAGIFWTIVVLVLILTGAIVPVLIFGGWALVAVLVVALIWMIIGRGFSLLLSPFREIYRDIKARRNITTFPALGDPDYAVYCDWVNGEGDYADFRDWKDVQRRRQWEREHHEWRHTKRGMTKWDKEHQRILGGGTKAPIATPAMGVKGWLVYLAALLSRCT